MRLVAALILVVLHGAAVAAPRLELRVDPRTEQIHATLTGAAMLDERLFLRDVDRGNRVPATATSATGPDAFTATFDLRTLSPDGKTHLLALDASDVELARTSIVLPGGDQPSTLRWLVIVGPLLGLVMIGVAVWIGRRTLRARPRDA